jgi:hypothetical protein
MRVGMGAEHRRPAYPPVTLEFRIVAAGEEHHLIPRIARQRRRQMLELRRPALVDELKPQGRLDPRG